MGALLPRGKMLPAKSMGKHDSGTAPGALVVDLGASVLNKAACNGGWVSVCGPWFFLRLTAGRHKRASSGKAGELGEVTTCDHGSEINSAIRPRPMFGYIRSESSQRLQTDTVLRGRPLTSIAFCVYLSSVTLAPPTTCQFFRTSNLPNYILLFITYLFRAIVTHEIGAPACSPQPACEARSS